MAERAQGPVERSPLEGFADALGQASASSGARLTLREIPYVAQLDFRTDPSESAVMDAVQRALGFALPLEPNTASAGAGRRALWLGPDEWLIVGAEHEAATIERALHSSAGDRFVSVVDVSANRTLIELRGPSARGLLAHGCSLDLHPRSFGPGSCAQTLLAKAQVILHQIDDTPTYHVYPRSSFASYLAEWLLDAMAEGLA